MKKILIFIIILILSHCSFDNKTGIWKNNTKDSKKIDKFKNFKTLSTKEKLFDKIIEPSQNLKISVRPIKKNSAWLNKNYNSSNNLDNFSYKNLNKIIFKSKKLNNGTLDENILFDGDKIIATNDKGDIIVYSISSKKITLKFNFYKKKFKNIKKKLSLTIYNKILYVTDNIGYIYALDYNEKKILWAKDFKIPFRSNLKVFNNKIITSDTNNVLYLINRLSGERLKSLPTEENPLKNNFSNSLALNNQFLFFLNTYGSIYSTNYEGDIRWFLNVNRSSSMKTNLFNSNPIVIHNDKIIISTDTNLYLMNMINGRLENKVSINSIVQPITSGKNLFLITNKNLLVCIDLNLGNIIYSIDISSQIANFLQTKKKSIETKTLFLSNNNLFLFLNNSYLVKISIKGEILEINKLPSKIRSLPIFINDSILYLNNKNRLVVID